MTTAYSEDKAIQFAYRSIHDFFDCYGLEDAIWHWETIIRAASNKHPWKKDAPFHLLLFMEKLGELCIAAITIHLTYAKRAGAIIGEEDKTLPPEISQQEQFVNSLQASNVWNCFPRNLTEKQYKDPYRALKKFAYRMPETACKKILKDIQDYALSRTAIDGEYSSYQLLNIRLQILQLIEACHLLEVRTYKN